MNHAKGNALVLVAGKLKKVHQLTRKNKKQIEKEHTKLCVDKKWLNIK